jgi:hypothetical protein
MTKEYLYEQIQKQAYQNRILKPIVPEYISENIK